MKGIHVWILTVVTVIFLVLGTRANAQEDNQFSQLIRGMHADRARVEWQLGLDPNVDPFPQATSYYDDKEDHYEQVQIASDQIAQGIMP